MAEFREDRAGIARMLRSPEMQRAMHRRTTRGLAFARFISPFVTGRYVRAFRIVTGVRAGLAWSRLINDAHDPVTGYPYCEAIEYGTRFMKAQRILGRTVDVIRRG